jgi:hypothetical protein
LRRILILLLALFASHAALAQGTLLQGGPWAPGHVPMYVGSGSGQAVVQDSGPAGGGGVGLGLSELGITARGSGTAPYVGQGTGPNHENVCDFDAPITNATGYHYLCFSPNATIAGQTGGIISYGAGGVAAPLPLSICVNNTCFSPGGGFAGLTVGSTTIGGTGRQTNGVLYDAAGVLAEYPVTGSGNAVLSAGPTLTGQPTAQGLTTTSPGWYAQIIGDAFPRVRVGPNSTDVASISFGPGNAARDASIERAGPAQLRFGGADIAAPIAQTLSVQNVLAGTSNTAGAALTINGSAGTGTGVGGNINFQIAPAGLTGSAQNPLATVVSITPTTALSITPTALSNNLGFNSSQSTPNGGTVAGPINLNYITVIGGTQTVTGSGDDSFGQIANRTNGFQVDYRVTGGTANHFGINSMMDVTGANGGTVGLNGGIRINSGSTITSPSWGVIGFLKIAPGSTLNDYGIGIESEVGGASTAAARDRIGVSAMAYGTMPAGSRTDAAFIASVNASATTPYNGATPFSNGLYFSSNFYGANAFPIATTGNIILADTGTVANLISAHTTTITGYVIDTPFVQITGSGSATFGQGSSATSNAVIVKSSTAGTSQISVNADGTAGFDGLSVSDSANAVGIFAGLQEASNTLTLFGQTSGNWGRLSTNGAKNLGLMVGTLTAQPLILGTNNTAQMTISVAGATTFAGNVAVNGGTITAGVKSSVSGAIVLNYGGGAVATTITNAANGGNQTIQTPNSSGTMAVSASGCIALNATTGALTSPTCLTANQTITLSGDVAGSGTTAITTTLATVATAGTTGSSTAIPVITIDVKGRTTSITTAVVVAPAGTLSGATLASGVTASSLTSFGASPTLATPVINGLATGTGVSSGNTASTLVNRDGSGNFAAGTISAALTGHASSDLALTGGTMSGSIAMGTNAITGLTTLAAAGGMTLQTNGSTLAGTITTGQNWGIGTETNPQGRLVVSNNAATGIAGATFISPYSAVLRVVGADNKSTSVEINSFAQNSRMLGTRADGTGASPSVIAAANELLFNFAAAGYDGSTNNYYTASAWLMWSSQAFTSGTNGGAYMTAYTTPNNTQTLTEAMRINGSGCVGVGTTTDCGIGSLLANVHLLAGTGTTPTVSSCGVSPSISGGDNFGTVTAGTGVLTSCVVNFGKTWGAAPRCVASSGTAIASLTVVASTTQLTIGGSSLTGDTINWVCGSTARLEPSNDNFAAFAFERTG